MPQSLGDLERQRSAILHGLTDLGDFRPGSITTTSGHCGKANCRCHRPNEPPHGPTDRLTYKVEGKTVSESLPNPAAFAKAEREVAEFRDYQRLSQQFVEVNTRICALRPVAETAPSAQEKNRRRDPAGSHPRSRSTAAHHFPRPQGNRPIDLESVEAVIRSAMHQAGAAALTQLLQSEPPDTGHLTVPCACGHTARFKEMRAKSFFSVVGTVEVRRPYYLCSHCSKGQHPADGELGIAGLESSPGVRRMEAMLGAGMPFVPAREPMQVWQVWKSLPSHRTGG
jgi:hypothetical protein